MPNLSSDARVAVGGPVLVVLVSWATSSAGDQPGDGMALANVALLLAVITVGVALVSWTGGLTTSIAAALSLNWFHTRPYGTFRVAAASDVVSIVCLGFLGVGVSVITARRVRAGTRLGRSLQAANTRDELEPLLAEQHPVEALWQAALCAASPDLGLVDARLVATLPDGMPVIARREWTDDPARASLVLPASGAALPLRGERAGYLVLTPQPGMGALTVDRRTVMSFADTIEVSLSR